MRTREERLGSSVIRWQPNKDGTYSGVVIRSGSSSETLHDEDEGRLVSRLRIQAGTLEPGYFGMDAAIARFLDFMPGGFEGEENLRREREYKVRAHENLNAILSAEQAAFATDEHASLVRSAAVWINLLSQLRACI